MANSFLTNSLDQAAERLWFQNPVQTLSPEIIRPISFSQVPSRLPIYEEDVGDTPQQTAAAAGGTQDFGSKFSMSTNINQKYNFDVQQDNTSFVFNMNNTNNMVEVTYATQDLINNNNNNVNIEGGVINSSAGTNAVIVSYSNGVWNEPNMVLDFDVQTATYTNGLLVSVTTTVHSVTLDALSELWQWYESGLTDSPTFGSGVSINAANTQLEQEYENWTFSHGLVTAITLQNPVGVISPLTDCP